MSQDIDKMKRDIQRLNSRSANMTTRVKVVSSAMETLGQNLDIKFSSEYWMLVAELQMEEKKTEVMSQKMTELNHQLHLE